MKMHYFFFTSMILCYFSVKGMENNLVPFDLLSSKYNELVDILKYDPKLIIFNEKDKITFSRNKNGVIEIACFEGGKKESTDYTVTNRIFKSCCEKQTTGFHHGYGDENTTALTYRAKGILQGVGYAGNFRDCIARGKIDRQHANLGQADAQDASRIAHFINDVLSPKTISFAGDSRGGGVCLMLAGHKEQGKYVYIDSFKEKLGFLLLHCSFGGLKETILPQLIQNGSDMVWQGISQTGRSISRKVPMARTSWDWLSSLIGYMNISNWVPDISKEAVSSSWKISSDLGSASSLHISNAAAPLIIPQYNRHDKTPLDDAQNLDPYLPVFYFTGGGDNLISPETGNMIAKARINFLDHEEGAKNTYIYVTKGDEDHMEATADSCEELDYIRAALHAFYKKNGYPYQERILNTKGWWEPINGEEILSSISYAALQKQENNT